MRHHWLLLGACGWVLLILMFVSKFISFRAVDGELLCVLCAGRHSQVKMSKCDQCVCVCVFSDYGDRAGQSWTVPGTKVVKPIAVSSPEKPVPKPSDQVTHLI